MRIYLAGGMRPRPTENFKKKGITFDELVDNNVPGWSPGLIAWADIVQQYLPMGHQVFDPRVSNTKVFEDYSFLDKMELRKCDLVIAYLEADNPSGAGLACEISFAHGLGKSVLLVNEKHEDRYWRFIENFADRVFTELAPALELIQKIRP